MRFRVHDGACDALLPGAVGTLAGHPGGLGSLLTCGCGHDDCPHPTPEPAPASEGADDDAPAEPPRIGHVWLDFAEDQLTEHKRAERGTLPEPEREPGVCPTCAGSRVIHLKAQRNEQRLVVDVPELPPGATELVIPHGMSPDAAGPGPPAYYPPPADPIDFAQPVVVPGGPLCDAVCINNDGTPGPLRCGLAEAHPGDHHHPEADGPGWGWQRSDIDADSDGNPVPPAEPEPLVPELLEVQCPLCKGTGVAPPPPPPLIPNNPLPFRAGVRADLVELVVDVGNWDAPLTELPHGTGIGGYGA